MIPQEVQAVLRTLEQAGHEAYVVGGCVRDMQMGLPPHDWDVTTSALPEETMALFPHFAIPTGLQHGTVTVRSGGVSCEVTTFRTDGDYPDHRHPAAVTFTRSLREDLARRDLTVNAMAMDAAGALHDPFGGREDIRRRVLRCVGDPERRFREDALRILRTLRFSATLGFAIEPETHRALRTQCGDLRYVAAERVREELTKLLCGQDAGRVLEEEPQVLGVVLPEILPCVGFDQHNRHHCYDVWGHTAHAGAAAPPDPVLRWTMLLHDLGKPQCFTLDKQGVGHFHGHHRPSAEMAESICRRLRFDKAAAQRICLLVRYHDRPISLTERAIRRAMNQLGVDGLRQLCAVKRADNLAQHPDYRGRQQEIDRGEAIMEELLAKDACFSLKQLAVNGQDMMALGLQGPAIGKMLQALLDAVMDGVVENERNALLSLAQTPKN